MILRAAVPGAESATMNDNNDHQARGDDLAERLFSAVLQTLELSHVWLGDRLGLYAALADLGRATPGELAGAAGIAERYAREWLEQQAVAAFVDVAVPSEDPAERRYSLPPEHAEVLLDPESLLHMVPQAQSAVSAVWALPEVRRAFETGEGVPRGAYAEGDEEVGNSVGDTNRPTFTHHLAGWLPHLPDLHARLKDGSPVQVADLGCGTGWSSISIARAFPSARVTGIDLDAVSIERAERNAAEVGVADRVAFRCASAGTLSGSYDLICAFECLHDMSDPVSVLRAARSRLAADGAMLVAEERTAEEFTAPGDEFERFHYGWSSLYCLPSSLTEQPSAAIGTAIRSSTVRSLGLSAGFSQVDVLPIEHDLWRFYRFSP